MTETTKKTKKTLEQIAREHLGIETLATRNSDHLDFHDVAVWSVAKALEAAYEAGRQAVERNATKQRRK